MAAANGSGVGCLQLQHLDTASLKLVANQLGQPSHQQRSELLASIQSTQSKRLPFTWTTTILAALPGALYGFSTVEYDGRLYLFGGRSGSSDPTEQCNTDFLCYDPAIGCWAVLQINRDVPEPRRWHSATVYQNEMVVFGGQAWTGSAWHAAASMLAFNFASKTWRVVKQHGACTTATARLSTALLDDAKLIVMPGAVVKGPSHFSSLASISVHDLATHTWATLACKGEQFDLSSVEAATTWQGNVYCLLVDDTADRMVVVRLDVVANTWAVVAPSNAAPCGRRQCSAVRVDSTWVVSGGVSTSGDAQFVFSDLHTYDFGTAQWTQLQVDDDLVPTARASHCATSLNGSAVFIGGWHQRWPAKLDNIILTKQVLEPHCSAADGAIPNLNLASCLSKLCRSPLFTDVLLVANDGQEFPAHKLMLVAQSEVFRKMLATDMQERNCGRVVLQASAEMVSVLLDYLYGGVQHISAEVVVELFGFSEQFDLEGLKLECKQRLFECVSVQNVTVVAQIAKLHELQDLWDHCIAFASSPKHQTEVFASQSFAKLWENDMQSAQLFTQQVASKASKQFMELQQRESNAIPPCKKIKLV